MVITRQIQKSRADLVVMGTHGTTGIREVLIGSNAEKIVRQSPSPVLVLKNYSKPKIKNIVLPVVPETESQTDFIDRIKSLQAFFKAKLHIVRINTPVNFTTDTLTRAQLGDFANENKIKNYTLNIFNHLNAASGILEFSQFIDADLIAMGTHGRRGLAHLFNGSNAEDIVNHADRMIWTYNLRKK
jgi:hypothetical protein